MNEENKRQKTTQYLGSCLKVNELPVNKNNNNINFTTVLCAAFGPTKVLKKSLLLYK